MGKKIDQSFDIRVVSNGYFVRESWRDEQGNYSENLKVFEDSCAIPGGNVSYAALDLLRALADSLGLHGVRVIDGSLET